MKRRQVVSLGEDGLAHRAALADTGARRGATLEVECMSHRLRVRRENERRFDTTTLRHAHTAASTTTSSMGGGIGSS